MEEEDFQRVSSLTRSTLLFGRFFSGVLSQVLNSLGLLDIHQLNYISFGSVIVAFVFSLFLPPVKQSIYFDSSGEGTDHQQAEPKSITSVVMKIFAGNVYCEVCTTFFCTDGTDYYYTGIAISSHTKVL